MKKFEAFKVRDEHIEMMRNPLSKDGDNIEKILKVKPPSSGGGLETSIRLIKMLHTLEEENGRNISPETSFEIWYENGNMTFNMYLPNEDQELHYRKQIAAHLEGVEIENNLNQFVNVEKGEYMAGARGKLTRHFFEPIKSKMGVRQYEEDPYLNILGEIDSKDNTRVVLQTMIKPASFDWYKTPNDDAISYGERLAGEQEMSRFFGLQKYKNDPDNEESSYANNIKKQVKDVAFHVNTRFMIFGEKKRVKQEAKHLDNMMEINYKEALGQTVDPRPISQRENINELLEDMLERNGRQLRDYRGIIDSIKEKISNNPILSAFMLGDFMKRRMMMTPNELGGLIHFPEQSDINTNAINWAEFTFSGDDSGDTGYQGLSEEEKRQYGDEKGD